MKSIIKNTLTIILIIIMVLQVNISIAATSLQNQQNQLQNQKNENEDKAKELEKQQEYVKNIKDETVKQVESLSNQISSYENEINQLDNQINQLNAKIKDEQEKLNQAQKDYEKQDELLKARLVASYEAGETSYLDFLLSSSSITELISNYYLITELATYDAELLGQIEKQKQEIADSKQELENSKKELDTSKAKKQSAATQLQASKNEKNNYVSQLSEEEKKLEQQLAEIAEANKSIDRDIAAVRQKIEEEIRKQQEQNNSGGNTSGGSSSSSGFIRPVNSYITTGIYYSNGRYHGAVDFGAANVNGMPVYAVADGIVVTTQALTTSYGNYVIIAHYNGLYTLYAHGQAGSIKVSSGQKVKQGQQIMNVGSTGNSTGPHLHFEVRKSPGNYSDRVDPTQYLP